MYGPRQGERHAGGLVAWDFVHCLPGTAHTILADGAGPAVILAFGARRERGSVGYPFEPPAPLR
jgi:hypothetical protein